MTTHTKGCPDELKLSQFLLGILSDNDSNIIESHFEDCDACLSRAENLTAKGDTLTDALDSNDTLRGALGGFLGGTLGDALGDALEIHNSSVAKEVRENVDLSFLSPSSNKDAEIGTLGQYRIIDVLGTGGMGIVLLAEDTTLCRKVALKVMRPELAVDAHVKDRFLLEARAIAAIEHENIVGIYEVGESNNVSYFAMPLLDGESLRSRLTQQKRLPVDEAVEIARQIASALAAAHSSGLIHRDIKPENIWLMPNGTVKLLDFGLARLTSSDASMTKSGLVVGTPQYLSPEQALGTTVDSRSDLFSLGVVIYQMLSGESPFLRDSLVATIGAIGHYDPMPLEAVCTIPRSLAALVKELISKDVCDRPASVEEVIRRLDKCRHEPVPQPTSNQPSRQRKFWAIAATLLLVIGGTSLAQVIVTISKDGQKSEVELKDGQQLLVDGSTGETELISKIPRVPTGPSLPPMSTSAVVAQPAKINDVDSWTIETIAHRGLVYAAEISPDGKWVAAMDWNRTVRIWDANSGEFEKLFVSRFGQISGSNVAPVAWSSDGKFLAVGCGDLEVFEVASGKTVLSLSDVGAASLSWSPNSSQLAISTGKGSVAIWDLAPDGQKPEKWGDIQTDDQTSTREVLPEWSPDGKSLAVAIAPEKHLKERRIPVLHVEIWQLTPLRKQKTLIGSDAPSGWVDWVLSWSPDNNRVAFTGNYDIDIWDLQTGDLKTLKRDELAPVLAWSANGKTLFDGIYRWNVESGEKEEYGVHTFEGKVRRKFRSVSRDGTRMVATSSHTTTTGNNGDSITVWNFEKGTSSQLFQHAVPAWECHLGWASSNEALGMNFRWNMLTGRRGEKINPEEVICLSNDEPSYSPDGKRALKISGSDVKIVSTDERQNDISAILVDAAKSGVYRYPRWSRDGKRVHLRNENSNVVWDTQTAKKIIEVPGNLAFMPADGKRLAVISSQKLYVLDISKPVATEGSPADVLQRMLEGKQGVPIDFATQNRSQNRSQNSPQHTAPGTSDNRVLIYDLAGNWAEIDLEKQAKVDSGTTHRQTIYDMYSPGDLFRLNYHNVYGALRFWDNRKDQLLGTVVNLPGSGYLSVSPQGHVASNIARYPSEIVYVVSKDDRQQCYSAEKFGRLFKWENNPKKVMIR